MCQGPSKLLQGGTADEWHSERGHRAFAAPFVWAPVRASGQYIVGYGSSPGTGFLTLAAHGAKQPWVGKLPGDRASRERETDPRKANVLDGWKGLVGYGRRPDMTKTRLAYAVYDARRAVSRQRRLSANPERMLGRSARLEMQRTRPSSPRSGGTCLEANPTPSQ